MTRTEHVRALARELGVEMALVRARCPYSFVTTTIGSICRTDAYAGELARFGLLGVKPRLANLPFFGVVMGYTGSNPSYFTALHELGHAAVGHHDDLSVHYHPRIIEAEAEAWEWALTMSKESPTAETVRRIAEESLGSYVASYGTATAGKTYAALTQKLGILEAMN